MFPLRLVICLYFRMESRRTFCIPPLMVLSLYISFYHFLINALSVSQSCGSGYFGRIPIGLKKKPDQDLVKYPGPKFLFKPVSLKDKERHFIRSDLDPGFQGRIRIRVFRVESGYSWGLIPDFVEDQIRWISTRLRNSTQSIFLFNFLPFATKERKKRASYRRKLCKVMI